MIKVEAPAIVCPACGRPSVIYDPDSNAYVCSACGSVVDERPADYGLETLIREESTPRVSGSFTNRVHDHGIGGTEIGSNTLKFIRAGDKKRWILRQKDLRVEKKDKVVKKALTHLNELVKLLKPPAAIAETASDILRKAVADGNYKERTLKKLAAAALYLAYKIHKAQRPLKEFAGEVGLTPSELWNAYSYLVDKNREAARRAGLADPLSIIPTIVKRSGLPPSVELLANKIADKLLSSHVLSGKSPSSIAAASVYVASIITGNKKTQTDVARTVGLTDVAIRNTYRDMMRYMDVTILM